MLIISRNRKLQRGILCLAIQEPLVVKRLDIGVSVKNAELIPDTRTPRGLPDVFHVLAILQRVVVVAYIATKVLAASVGRRESVHRLCRDITRIMVVGNRKLTYQRLAPVLIISFCPSYVVSITAAVSHFDLLIK